MTHPVSLRFRDDAARDAAEHRALAVTGHAAADVRFVVVSRGSPIETDVGMLVERRYAARGLRLGAVAAGSGDDESTTIAALRGTRVLATVSVRGDGPQGLLAEHLYPREIETHRRRGGRLCELTRLAADPQFGSQPALASLFDAAYRVAVRTYGATDFVMEVHPRHAAYYSRMVGCRIVGPETLCPRVHAPAVLLHMCAKRVQDHMLASTTAHAPGGPTRRSAYGYLQRTARSEAPAGGWISGLALAMP